MSDLATAFARGALWSVGMRWSVKAIGLVSTVVLARLLTPADFGIVAIAMVCVAFVDVWFTTGSEAVVLRDAGATRELIDSAWTFKLIESLCIAGVLAVTSTLAADFFHEPRLVPILLALSLGIAAAGLSSFGPLLARKALDFSVEVRLLLVSKLISFGITLALAFWLRNYWALVIGAVSGYVTSAVLTYVFHEYRPRLRVSHIPQIWRFSQWMVVASIGSFFAGKTDSLLLARVGSAGDMGLYTVAAELGQTVTVELNAPMNRALLPVLAQVGDSQQRFREALAKMVAATNIVILPAGFGLAAIGTQTVDVVLGHKWTAAAPLLTIFAIAWALRYMVGPYSVAFIVAGKPRVISVLVWIEALTLIGLGLALASHGVEGLAWARASAMGIVTLGWVSVGASFGFGWTRFARAVWRPLLGAALMYALLKALPSVAWIGWPVLDLLMRIVAGAAFYCAWILVTWLALGRPDGLESRVLALLRTVVSAPRRSRS